jgi:hypothetical protein
MSLTLLPCPACARHVRANEPNCPFCVTPLPAHYAATRHALPSQRLGRGAMFAFSTTLGLAGCHRSTPTQDPTTIAQPYGVPVDPRMAIAPDVALPVATHATTDATDVDASDASPPLETHTAVVDAAAEHRAPHRTTVHPHHDPGSGMADYGAPPADNPF